MTSASPDSSPISVLFVCLGNICRSPLAEAVFRKEASCRRDIGILDSAGTAAYHTGSPPDSRTMDVLRNNGIQDYQHAARKVKADDFRDFDYIFGMDQDNVDNLIAMRRRLLGNKESSAKAQIILFGDFGDRKGEQVQDPYYGANSGFTKAYDQSVRFSKGFISQVLDKLPSA